MKTIQGFKGKEGSLMKKLCCLFLIALMLLPVPSLAEPISVRQHWLPEIGLSVPVPLDYVVFTRDTPQDDPAYAATRYEYENIQQFLWAGNFYLFAVSLDASKELTVYANPVGTPDFSEFDRSELEAIALSTAQELIAIGQTFDQAQIRYTDYATYVVVAVHDDSAYHILCSTVRNGVMYTIRSISRGAALSEYEEGLFYGLLENTAFEGDELGELNEARWQEERYVNEAGRISFPVPEGWARQEPAEEPFSLILRPEENDGCSIMFTQEDLWAQNEAYFTGQGMARADVDISKITIEGAAGSFGVAVADVEIAYYAGMMFYKTVQTWESDGGTVTATLLLTVQNGMMYEFIHQQVNRVPGEAHEMHFEALLSNIALGEWD